MGYFGWRPYVPVAERRRKAERAMQKLKKSGHALSPVVITGRAIATTFWGKAWCDNLERYSDYANRLPRGRTYARNGSVVDLQIAPGEVNALVSGSDIYKVAVSVAAVPGASWTAICTDCAGEIGSLVELLQGRFARGVMERICQPKTGLFPSPAEIQLSCSCPDWASMCKHVAAVLYGIGARLDERPELLFTLRKVDQQDLIAQAATGIPLARKGPAGEKVLAGDDLSALFGLELGTGDEAPGTGTPPEAARPAGAPRGARATPARGGREATARSAGRRSVATRGSQRAKTTPGDRAPETRPEPTPVRTSRTPAGPARAQAKAARAQPEPARAKASAPRTEAGPTRARVKAPRAQPEPARARASAPRTQAGPARARVKVPRAKAGPTRASAPTSRTRAPKTAGRATAPASKTRTSGATARAKARAPASKRTSQKRRG
jgi:hypothetical protein